jgi:hypothetical protein
VIEASPQTRSQGSPGCDALSVTPYSTVDCPPREAGRWLLLQRVPFTEKRIVATTTRGFGLRHWRTHGAVVEHASARRSCAAIVDE